MTKTVIITGASRGIGLATAEQFLKQGWRVIGTSTTGGQIESQKNLTMLSLKLEDEDSIIACVESLAAQGITPNVLINNAAINPGPDDEYLVPEKVSRTVGVNLLGLISLTEKLLPHLLPEGRVINLTSSASNVNNEYIQQSLTPYGIAKAGVNLYTHNLAKRFKDKGLIVVALHPGWVRTDMGSQDAPKMPSDVAEELWELATGEIQTDTLWENKQVINWW
jgi:NAD(P)-dependent dehydrogenase (short-subunit alcohol dehydrogenase family)